MPLYRAPTIVSPEASALTYAESEGNSSTTSTTTWQNKVTITTPAIVNAGTYVIFWYIRAQTSAANRDFEIRIIDGSSNVVGYYQTRNPQAASEIPFTGYDLLPLVTGTFSYTMQFKMIGSGTLTVSNARLTFWRIE